MKRIISVLALVLVLCFALQGTCFAVPVFKDAESAGEYIASKMKKIAEKVEFDYTCGGITSESELNEVGTALLSDIFDATFAHTGDPNGGDYLRYTYDNMNRSVRMELDGKGNCNFHFTYDFSYNVTPTQEKELTQKLEEDMPTLLADCKNDYDIVCAIHSYILKTVTYDHDSPDSYMLRYTAYAAAINGTSVCEGYALLFYRMCLMAGLDCRVILGKSYGGDHAWNIVKLDGKWYNIDCTWDDTIPDRYFLRGTDNFPNHTSTATYITSEYDVSETDFDRAAYFENSQTVKGDADGNGKINVFDARSALRVALGRANAVSAGVCFPACDMNSDGKITVSDARAALRLSIGLDSAE